MKFNRSLALALVLIGLSFKAQATENQTEPLVADNSYKIEFAMNLNEYGELDRFSILAINYPGDNFNEDMDDMCRGLMQDDRTEAILIPFKSAKNTDEENAELLPVPNRIEFQCLIP